MNTELTETDALDLAGVKEQLETEAVRETAEIFNRMKKSFGEEPPSKMIDFFHAVMISARGGGANELLTKVMPKEMLDMLDRSCANGMALGYLLHDFANKEAEERKNAN